MRQTALLLALTGVLALGCRTPSNGAESGSETLASGSLNSSITLPAPVAANTKYKLSAAEVDRIAEAMLLTYERYYGRNANGYVQTPSGTASAPSEGEITRCRSVAPLDRWSHLMALYYATFPTYTAGYFPSMRECFSYLVSPNTGSHTINGKKPNFVEAYDYCAFMPIDRQGFQEGATFVNWATASQSNVPAFDPANKANKKAVGPMGWVYESQDDVFKFVMLSGRCGIAPASQQEVINKFFASLPATSAIKNAVTTVPNDCP